MLIQHELKLVTVFHPEVLTQLMGISSTHLLPHRIESRQVRKVRQAQFMAERQLTPTERFNDGIPILDIGKEIATHTHHLVSGKILGPHLGDPRLIYIPDEPKPLRKWRIEFRRRWRDSEGELSTIQRDSLQKAIHSTLFAVKAVWLNPPEPFWINLVLYLPADPNRNQARLKFSLQESLPFLGWHE